jgi:hypothetical protein
MEALATELTFQGRTLRQLKRIGRIAIYEVRNRGNLLYGYEVIEIKIAPAEEICGRFYPEREVYPSSAKNSPDWGSIAWSFGAQSKKRAFALFNGLVKTATEGRATPTETDFVAGEGKDSGDLANALG